MRFLSKPTQKSIENSIKNCLRHDDEFTALNYYDNFKDRFPKLDMNKLVEEVRNENKPKVKIEIEKEEKQEEIIDKEDE